MVRLVRELQVGSYPIEAARLSNDADADTLAYREWWLFMRALENIRLEAYGKAGALFLEALERDPQNVMARLGLGLYPRQFPFNGLCPIPASTL